MENKNSVLVFSVIFLIIGVFVGWFGSSSKDIQTNVSTGNHMMSNGQMMGNSSMDMGNAMSGMMNGLAGKTGDAFDKAFIDGMIEHHEGAVVMAEEALKNAKHQEIKDMANAIISAQTKEIDQMKEWRLSWYEN